MSIRIAVPNNKIYRKLYSNIDELKKEFDISLKIVSEQQCSELFKANLADIALLTPLGYGAGLGKADYRIIPGVCLSYEGYNGFASICFKEGLSHIKSIASPAADDFLMLTGKILMSERYNVLLPLIKKNATVKELLKEYDSVIYWEDNEKIQLKLDVCEMWQDSFETPLPVAFWVALAEEYPDDAVEIVNRLMDKTVKPVEEITEFDYPDEQYEARFGNIYHQWNEKIMESMEHILQMLYYYQMFKDIPAIKILEPKSYPNSVSD